MLVIIIAVITQGARIPPDLHGTLNGSLFINAGVFQAIGVISFGMWFPYGVIRNVLIIIAFVCRTASNTMLVCRSYG